MTLMITALSSLSRKYISPVKSFLILPSRYNAIANLNLATHCVPKHEQFRNVVTSLRSVSIVDYDHILPKDLPRRKDVLVGLEAVRKACSAADLLQPDYPIDLEKKSGLEDDLGLMKEDLSPVTIADFAAQAIVLRTLYDAFGDQDGFIAEESSESLRNDSVLASNVLKATKRDDWSLEELFSAIDLGKMYINKKTQGKKRIWTCDPIGKQT